MSETANDTLIFSNEQRLGKVSAVDTTRVLIAVDAPNLLPRAAVGSLVAIQGMTAQEFLIGMTERVTRQLAERLSAPEEPNSDAMVMTTVPDDGMRVVLLGTFRAVHGSARNQFKRGGGHLPTD